MTLQQLATEVEAMREAQRRFFRTRQAGKARSEALARACQLECVVDSLVREILHPPPGLFDQLDEAAPVIHDFPTQPELPL